MGPDIDEVMQGRTSRAEAKCLYDLYTKYTRKQDAFSKLAEDYIAMWDELENALEMLDSAAEHAMGADL